MEGPWERCVVSDIAAAKSPVGPDLPLSTSQFMQAHSQGCSLGLNVSVSRMPRIRSRLGRTGKRVGLGIESLGLGIGLGQLGLVHISVKTL